MTDPAVANTSVEASTATLEALLVVFDPVRHQGEAMAFLPVGQEIGTPTIAKKQHD